MGLANDLIDTDEKGAGGAVSRRPIVLAAGLFAGLGALAIALTTGARDERNAAESEAKEVLYVPDHASAERLRAQATKPTQAAPTAPDENLGVTESVPKLPGDAVVATGPGAYLAQKQALYDNYLLQVQQQALDSRLKARSAGLRVAAFETARQERAREADEAAELLARSGLGDAAEEAPLGGLGQLGQLALAGAGPSLAALSGAGGGRGFAGPGVAGLGGGGGQEADPNFNGAKVDFFQNGGKQLEPGRLNASVRPATSPYELQMGAIIPGVLISGINSEAPGQITGQVSENVYDSATGRYLLIPQGSKLVGTYSALIAHGQTRVQVAWVRLNFPNGNKLDLGGMSGADQAGTSGFRDRVNRHFAARLAAALMTTAFSVSYELTQPQNGSFYEGAIHRGVGESIVQLGKDIAQQEGQRPPTLEIRPGYRFLINVSKDIVFPSPYEDGIQRRRPR